MMRRRRPRSPRRWCGQALRGQLGYQGVVVTDAMDALGLIQYMRQQGYTDPAQGIAEACVRAFLAGDDLIEAPIEQDRLAATVTAMTRAVVVRPYPIGAAARGAAPDHRAEGAAGPAGAAVREASPPNPLSVRGEGEAGERRARSSSLKNLG